MKLNPAGEILLTIGTKGQAGTWDDAAGAHLLNQPNDVAIAANGDIFVAQGHTPGASGDARVLKFDKTGKFIKQWGGNGKEPGKFEVAHRSPSMRRVSCGWPIARTSASRCSTPTASTSAR